MGENSYGLLNAIRTSPYMKGIGGVNAQYAKIGIIFEQGSYLNGAAASSALLEEIMKYLYFAVTGEREPLSVILSDISFWNVIDDTEFCDTAGVLHFTCYRMTEVPEDDRDLKELIGLIRSGIDTVIEHTAWFLLRHGRERCLPPEVLRRDDVRRQYRRMFESLGKALESFGYGGGVSMDPPYLNLRLLDFPDEETRIWAQYSAKKLYEMGMLISPDVKVLDSEAVVLDRVGMTNELIRRAAAGANGGTLLVDRFDAFNMPCMGENLMDRALRTLCTAAEKYRGSLSIVIAGQGDAAAKKLTQNTRVNECFPFLTAVHEE